MPEKVEVDARLLRKVLAGFWAILAVLFASRAPTHGWPAWLASLALHVPEVLLGAWLSWLMTRLLQRGEPQRMDMRLIKMVGLCLPMGYAFSLANALTLYETSVLIPGSCPFATCALSALPNQSVVYSINFAFVFFAWGALYLGSGPVKLLA